MKNCILCSLLLIFFACAPLARGALFNITVDGDRYVKESGTVVEDTNGLIVGVAGTPKFTAVGVLPFELPVIPVGHVVVGANLSFSAYRFGPQSGAPFVDIYGLDVRANNTVLSTDYFFLDGGEHDPNAALIQDAILSPGLGTGPPFSSLETDASADSALVGYLNDQVADGAVAGNFAFLRFNVDRSQAGDNRLYRIGSSAGSLGAVLTIITAVPEPTAGSLITCGMLAILWRRRRAPKR